MTLTMLWLLVTLTGATLVDSATWREGRDATQTSMALGSGVVESVTDRIGASCIFDDDKLMLRRLAYVESNDGRHRNTFRGGYYGGIWQVDEVMYNHTKGTDLQTFITAIRHQFQIDWMTTTWQDLLMPMYSALAARLYLQHKLGQHQIPRSIAGQADYWKTYYRPSGRNFVESSNQLVQGCQKSQGADLVFVLDGCGSIGSDNFDKIKQFVESMVDGYEIGPDKTRVGVIQYGSSVRHEFDLNTHSTKNDVITAVRAITYMNANTYIDRALDAMVAHSFQEINGARDPAEGHPRVAIVLTNGVSENEALTIAAAERAHEADITMLAIGVGSSLNERELTAIASEPTCLHLFYLDFAEVEDLHQTIEKRACEAPIIIGTGDSGTKSSVTIPPGGNQNCKLRIPQEGGATVKLVTSLGASEFYVAKDTFPSRSYYEYKVESTPGNKGVMYIPGTGDEESIYFCNIQGGNETETNVSLRLKPGGTVDTCQAAYCSGLSSELGDFMGAIQAEMGNIRDSIDGAIRREVKEVGEKMRLNLTMVHSELTEKVNTLQQYKQNRREVNGQWGAWSQYSSCSVTCGEGTKQRSRQCDNPAPAHGGCGCLGDSTRSMTCYENPCPVDGQWGEWSQYSSCSVTRGTGTKQRVRQCDNPTPDHGGSDCLGDRASYTPCHQKCVLTLLLATRLGLRHMTVDNDGHTLNATDSAIELDGVLRARAIDYDPIDEHVYWSDIEAHTISRAHLNGSGQEVILRYVPESYGMAIDWQARNIYWTDMDELKMTIEVASLDGTSRRILLAGLHSPYAIALDLESRHMYWTNQAPTNSIERANLDGSARQVLVTGRMMAALGLVLDTAAQKMYWADHWYEAVEVANLDGTQRRRFIERVVPKPQGMTLLGDFIYWSTQYGAVERADKGTGFNHTDVSQHGRPNYGIKAVPVTECPGYQARNLDVDK